MENELKANALSMGSKGQHELRKTIIRMLKDGKKGKEIAKDLGVSEGHVSSVKKLYDQGGAKALQPKKRGRQAGKNLILLLAQLNREFRCGMRNRSRQGTKPQEYWTYFKVE